MPHLIQRYQVQKNRNSPPPASSPANEDGGTGTATANANANATDNSAKINTSNTNSNSRENDVSSLLSFAKKAALENSNSNQGSNTNSKMNGNTITPARPSRRRNAHGNVVLCDTTDGPEAGLVSATATVSATKSGSKLAGKVNVATTDQDGAAAGTAIITPANNSNSPASASTSESSTTSASKILIQNETCTKPMPKVFHFQENTTTTTTTASPNSTTAVTPAATSKTSTAAAATSAVNLITPREDHDSNRAATATSTSNQKGPKITNNTNAINHMNPQQQQQNINIHPNNTPTPMHHPPGISYQPYDNCNDPSSSSLPQYPPHFPTNMSFHGAAVPPPYQPHHLSYHQHAVTAAAHRPPYHLHMSNPFYAGFGGGPDMPPAGHYYPPYLPYFPPNVQNQQEQQQKQKQQQEQQQSPQSSSNAPDHTYSVSTSANDQVEENKTTTTTHNSANISSSNTETKRKIAILAGNDNEIKAVKKLKIGKDSTSGMENGNENDSNTKDSTYDKKSIDNSSSTKISEQEEKQQKNLPSHHYSSFPNLMQSMMNKDTNYGPGVGPYPPNHHHLNMHPMNDPRAAVVAAQFPPYPPPYLMHMYGYPPDGHMMSPMSQGGNGNNNGSMSSTKNGNMNNGAGADGIGGGTTLHHRVYHSVRSGGGGNVSVQGKSGEFAPSGGLGPLQHKYLYTSNPDGGQVAAGADAGADDADNSTREDEADPSLPKGRNVNRCDKMLPPITLKLWSEEQINKSVIPDFPHLVNFPAHLHRYRVLSEDQKNFRRCVMCGESRLCSTSGGGTNSRDSSSRSKSKTSRELTKNELNGHAPIIPKQNKGLCTACDVAVWVITESKIEIKWCKGCKNFRAWAAFGDKGLGTKCLRCRERQREKYANKKAAGTSVNKDGYDKEGNKNTPKTLRTSKKKDSSSSKFDPLMSPENHGMSCLIAATTKVTNAEE